MSIENKNENMAASVGADSYNFLRSSLSKQNILVVGDGNFSFSLSLAMFRDEIGKNTSLVLTSFDSSDVLKQDEFTRVNLERLQERDNVEVMYHIDATKLSEHFLTRKFSRIIFNFPHTGGKSNIKKCRKLLEDFFMSAVEHVDLDDGDICVTLCKGQGGTPVDKPQRSFGNSWQIVNNAAKAGLILHELHHFVDSDYSQYKSVGYRGKLTKGFHTTGGLIHIFLPGMKLAPLEDLGGQAADTILSHVCKQYHDIKNTSECFAIGHPLCFVRNEIFNLLNNAMSGTSFEEILGNSDVEDMHRHCGNTSADCLLRCGKNMSNTVTYNERILSAMKKSSSFISTGVALAIFEEITCELNINMRYLAIGRFFDTENKNNLEKADSEQEKILDELKKLFSTEMDYVHEVHSKTTVTDSKVSTWTNSSEVAHLARNKCQLKRKADAEQSSDCNRATCCCQMLCREYLRMDYRIGPAQRIPIEFFHQDTSKIFKTRSAVVVICGHVSQEVLKLAGHRHGWLILVNLDVLAMVQYNLSDIRILASNCVKWERKSMATAQEDGLNEPTTITPMPTNIFPPEYVHDISFWISDDISQELFFVTTIALTKNCVKEIRLTEIYHEEDKHWLCFNYRMIYSRVDGPLSHFEAVELQNRLRRALIVLGFGLK